MCPPEEEVAVGLLMELEQENARSWAVDLRAGRAAGEAGVGESTEQNKEERISSPTHAGSSQFGRVGYLSSPPPPPLHPYLVKLGLAGKQDDVGLRLAGVALQPLEVLEALIVLHQCGAGRRLSVSAAQGRQQEGGASSARTSATLMSPLRVSARSVRSWYSIRPARNSTSVSMITVF